VTPRHLVCALFDLDNTLYPKSAGVMDVVSQRINEYMALRLGMDEATIKALRPRYWKKYGTTMRGLLLEHGINADDYLGYVHGFSVQELLAPNAELDEVLKRLPWRKVIFTSSTREHTQQVLEALAIAGHFARTFDIRDTGYICKPDPVAYHVVLQELGLRAEQCLLADDSLPNLQTAAGLGMVTVWVGSQERADGVRWAIDRIERIADVALAQEESRRRGEQEPCLTK
jgi:putative hydrolase of the HAD superfamily